MWPLFRNIVNFLLGGRPDPDRAIFSPSRQASREPSPSPGPLLLKGKSFQPPMAPAAEKKHLRKPRSRRQRSKPAAGVDRHGFRRLTERDDLRALFLDSPEAEGTEKGFKELVEETFPPGKQRVAAEGGPGSGTSTSQVPIAARLRHYPAPEEELDLHGLTGPEAARRTEQFIRNAGMRGLRTVRLITGKGIHSENGPVLPDVAERQAATLKAAGIVLTFRWERRAKRQSGALLVYLQDARGSCNEEG